MDVRNTGEGGGVLISINMANRKISINFSHDIESY